jgi:hypothetical protein
MTSIEESIEDALRDGGVTFPADAPLEDKVRFDQLAVQMDSCCSQGSTSIEFASRAG